ncbi:MAG: signal peptidase II [Syntrophobacteraceae bacterium]
MQTKTRLLLAIFIFILGVGIDQASKQFARAHFPKKEAVSLLGDTVRLQCYENVGGVFSLEYSLPQQWQGTPFTIATSFFMGLLFLILASRSQMRPLSAIAVSLIFAGCFSNFFNRIVPPRIVVDFIDIGWGNLRSNLFNIADAEIIAGLTLVAISSITSFCHRCTRKILG